MDPVDQFEAELREWFTTHLPPAESGHVHAALCTFLVELSAEPERHADLVPPGLPWWVVSAELFVARWRRDRPRPPTARTNSVPADLSPPPATFGPLTAALIPVVLEPLQIEALYLHDVEGYGAEEVAERLGLPEPGGAEVAGRLVASARERLDAARRN